MASQETTEAREAVMTVVDVATTLTRIAVRGTSMVGTAVLVAFTTTSTDAAADRGGISSETPILREATTRKAMMETMEVVLTQAADRSVVAMNNVTIAPVAAATAETEWVTATTLVDSTDSQETCGTKSLPLGTGAEVGARSDMKHGY